MGADSTNANHKGLATFRVGRPGWLLREIIAITLWLFAFTKLVVFDIDVYLVDHFAPAYHWVLDAKFIILVVTLALLWWCLDQTVFAVSVFYILFYPIVLVVSRVPQYVLRAWPLALAFAPIILFASKKARSTFVLYTIALVATLGIATQRDARYLILSMIALGLFLVVHLYRRVVGAHSSNLFADLARLARQTGERIKAGDFEQRVLTQQAASGTTAAPPSQSPAVLSQLYLTYSLADFVSGKVKDVARGRKYELYLVVCLIYTVVVTSVVYTLEYWALNRVAPASFRGADGAGIEGFFRFSLGVLTTSNVSSIIPSSTAAGVLASTELVCSFVILIILVFIILTAARESFREDIADFSTELQRIAGVVERRLVSVYSLRVGELERILLQESNLVNTLRRLRGLDAIALPVPYEPIPQAKVARGRPARGKQGGRGRRKGH